MAEKKFKRVCKCENCSNEAEMVVTCQLEPEEAPSGEEKKLKGQAVCTHCGNEADMWIDV